MNEQIQKHRREIARAYASGNYEQSDGGILIKGVDVLASGVYYASVNGGDTEEEGTNLLPEEGLHHMLNAGFLNL